MAERSIYDSARMAAGYAFSRPPVHCQIIRAIAGRLPGGTSAAALDIGCGAGLSTAALAPVASRRVGLEPVAAMLAHAGRVAPGATFVVGRAERLPFPAGSFDLVSAAGSLNYVDLRVFLPEAARVLRPRGTLLVYDFSAARRLRGDDRLDRWFSAFEARYPFPPGYEMDIRTAPLAEAGLDLREHTTLEVGVPMMLSEYLDYVMSETNVEQAVEGGESEAGIMDWCRPPLEAIFGVGAREILFDAYAALIARAPAVTA